MIRLREIKRDYLSRCPNKQTGILSTPPDLDFWILHEFSIGIYFGSKGKLVQMQSSIITIDGRGKILSVDKYCCKLFGYDVEELVGGSVNKIIPSPYKEQHDAYLQNYQHSSIPKIIGKNRIVEGEAKDGSVS